MNRPLEVIRGGVAAISQRFSAQCSQSERTILLATILLASAVSGTIFFVLTRYFSFDLASYLLYPADDCWMDWGMKVGRHCFGDYAMEADQALRPNPWGGSPIFVPPGLPLHNPYPPASMVPHLIFALLGKWVGAPRVGLFGYLLVLIIAVLSPALWASRGARGLERVVIFVACGVLAIPAWSVIDRANSVGFVVPIALVFLVALCRQRWVLAGEHGGAGRAVKTTIRHTGHRIVAARRWRVGGIAVVGGLVGNLAAYALWPRDFPGTIALSLRYALGYGAFYAKTGMLNTSFGKGIFMIPDAIAGHGQAAPYGFLEGPRSLIGYAVLLVVVMSVLVLGRRIAPVMAGIALLATASLFPAVSNAYYLVFALPVAALVLRDPDGPSGSGIFDRLATLGDRRRAVGICVTLAAALSIAPIAAPRMLPPTTTILAPTLWLIACAAIIVSYARRPAGDCAPADTDTSPASGEPTSAAVG